MPGGLPEGLRGRRGAPAGWDAWLDGVPRLLDEVLDRWHLRPDGEPIAGHTALVWPVLDADGARRALKTGLVEEDNSDEAATLQLWGGRGAVSLLRADPRRGVLLLEWLGSSLADHQDDAQATEAVAALHPVLHRRGTPRLRSVHPFVLRWLDEAAALGRDLPAPPRFVDQALAAGRRLAAEPATHVVHGDLHQGNVLERDGEWVAIDPKGFLGDPCYDVAPLLWNRWDDVVATGSTGQAVRDRLYAVADAAGLDELRCRDWSLVRVVLNLAWAVADARREGREPDDTDNRWITRMVTIAKALQAVGHD